MNSTQWIILDAAQKRTKQREKLPEKERKIAERKERMGGAYSCFVSGVICLLINIWIFFNIKNKEKDFKNFTFWQALPKIFRVNPSLFIIFSILSTLFFLAGWWLLSSARKLQEEIKVWIK